MRPNRLRLTLLAAPLALVLGAPVRADQVVYFTNGKAIMVKSIEKGEKFTVLEMDGGGRIGVPTDQIARIEEYTVSAPAAPQAAPPPVAAPVAAQTPAEQPARTAGGGPIGIPSNLPPAPPMTPGPGVGGRPLTAPGRGIADLRPLDISGGAAPAPALQRRLPVSRLRNAKIGWRISSNLLAATFTSTNNRFRRCCLESTTCSALPPA